jgi:uncharacterized protein YbjT (DUF2867 family)
VRRILVTGARGSLGANVVGLAALRDLAVRALVRHPDAAGFPAGVEVLRGDALD